MGAHGRDQFAAARRQRDAIFQDFVDHADRQALEQRHPLAQRRLERDLAAHRAFGNGGDMRLHAGEIGELVDAFLADHGGIHVGEKKLLAPDRLRLHDNVDWQIAAHFAQACFDRMDVALGDEGDVDGDFVEQPPRRAGRGQNGARAVDHRAIERGIDGIADERDDERHAVNSQPENSNAVLIAGPTASGKSALALELAQKTGGVVINTDSMQVYRDLRIITARPARGRGSACSASALWSCRCRGEFFRRKPGWWMPPGCCRKCARNIGCRSSSAARVSTSRR